MSLFIEHLNRICKEAINGLKENKSKKALIRVSKVVGKLDKVLNNFNNDNSIGIASGKHKVACNKRDFSTVLNVLLKEKCVKYSSGRCYQNFTNVVRNPIQLLTMKN